MCVCTISSGSCSLTKFKVDEDSTTEPNKNSRHLRTLSLKYLSAVFKVHVIMAIPINQNFKFLKMEHFNKLLSRSLCVCLSP